MCAYAVCLWLAGPSFAVSGPILRFSSSGVTYLGHPGVVDDLWSANGR